MSDAFDWMDEALCTQVGTPEAWFPHAGAVPKVIRDTCKACQVTEQCLQFADDTDTREGTYGGHSEIQRKKDRAKLPKQQRVNREH